MKKLKSIFTVALLVWLVGCNSLFAQSKSNEYLGLPGDNLNLYAVLDIFQSSETIEAFERNINDQEKLINNLDLNGDNLVDYIMVYDYVEGNIHTIVLRVALSKKELQDVAVFTVQQFGDGTVQVQLIGDEALYGQNYIVEPIYAETPNPGYTGNAHQSNGNTVVTTTYREVASWPVIVYLYQPVYRPWQSAWYWGYYPSYWNPWAPHYWHYYSGYHSHWHGHYYAYYRPWDSYRCGRYRNVYVTNIRNYSPTVIVNVNNGRYRDTYSRPERKRDGENYFAQRYPNGTPRPIRQSSNNERVERDRTNSSQGVKSNGTRPVRGEGVGNNRPNRQAEGSRKPRETQRNGDNVGRSNGNRESGTVTNRPPRKEATTKPQDQSQRPVRGETTKPAKREQRPARGESTRPAKQEQRSPVRNESASPKREKESKPASRTKQSESKRESKGSTERSGNRRKTS